MCPTPPTLWGDLSLGPSPSESGDWGTVVWAQEGRHSRKSCSVKGGPGGPPLVLKICTPRWGGNQRFAQGLVPGKHPKNGADAVQQRGVLLWPLTYPPLCPLQRCCPHPLRPKGSGAMGPGALSSLLLLLLFSVATGGADMTGNFNPGEEAGSWVPEGGTWETESQRQALTCLSSPSQVPLCPGHAGPDHPRRGHLCL